MDKRKYIVYFSLGSNLGDKIENLKQGISLINERVGGVLNKSSIYSSEPWGQKELNKFYNLVLKVETTLTPIEVLALTQQIERDLGRAEKKQEEYENRVIDIDLLFYDALELKLERLTIPHALLHLRKFVLQPLAEIDSDLIHPALNKSVLTLLENCEDENKIKILQ